MGKHWLSNEEKKLLYNLKNPEKYTKYKKKIKERDIEKESDENLEKELKETEISQSKKPTDLRPICYECGLRFDYRANNQPLPHNYCPECYSRENFKMQSNLNRMPYEIRKKYEAYVRAGIIGYYDWSPESRELHDSEMRSYTRGMMKISEAAYDDLDVNKEYLKRTLSLGEERKGLEIADDIINHLDWNQINLGRRRKHWKNLLSSLREEGIHIKKMKTEEKIPFVPSLEFQLREKDLEKYVTLHIRKEIIEGHKKV